MNKNIILTTIITTVLLLSLTSCADKNNKTSYTLANVQAYTMSNVQAHNDYEKLNTTPFVSAYEIGIGYIEADIWLMDDNLYVAHSEEKASQNKRSLSKLYLEPLSEAIKKNGGYGYKDKMLNFCIDIKTEADPTLAKLVSELEKYPAIIGSKNLTIIVSGNRGDIDKYTSYPTFINFDGRLDETYAAGSLAKVALISHNVNKISSWNNKSITPISADDKVSIKKEVDKVHSLGKPIRFWNTPETTDAWLTLMDLQVDVIGTDHIYAMQEFLKDPSKEVNFEKLKSIIGE